VVVSAGDRHSAGRRKEAVVAHVCEGCLVVHRDGLVAFCTEDLDGRRCPGYHLRHLGGSMSCRVVPRIVHCLHCQHALQLRLVFAAPFVPALPDRVPALAN
jgi:hypothetical protein